MNLEYGAYYFCYANINTENGIYAPVEDIALYEAIGKDNVATGLLRYPEFTIGDLTDDSKNTPVKNNQVNNNQIANNKNETKNDQTVAKDKIPQTGEAIGYVLVTIIFIVVASIGYMKFKQYKDIK